MMITVYGISNCSTIRKAKAWLDAHGVAYRFHDYRKDGISAFHVRQWIEEIGWDRLINRSGTTFRTLSDAEKALHTEDQAIALMVAHPTVIRRPVVEGAGPLLTGFDPEVYATVFRK